MRSPGWWIFDLCSRMLDADERSAVRGDLVEAGVSGAQACKELSGLIARRQIAAWKSWQPWIAFFAIVYLLVPLLLQCVDAVRHMVIAYSTGARLPSGSGGVLLSGAWLTVLWSWSSGFTLARLSRRTVWIQGPLFIAAAILGVPYGIAGSGGAYRQIANNPAHEVLSWTLAAALLLLPSLWGLWTGLQAGGTNSCRFSASIMIAAVAIPIGILAASAGWTPEAYVDRLSAYAVLSWPVGFLAVTSFRRPETSPHPRIQTPPPPMPA